MDLRDVLKRRKMVRAFEQRPVPPDVVERIVSAVRHAPTAGHSQGNEYLVLDDPNATSTFWRLTEYPSEPYTDEDLARMPPLLVVVCSNKQAYLDRYSSPDKAPYGLGDESAWPVPYWDVDAGMAAMLIMLAAIDEGLATWFFGLMGGEAELLSHFGAPDRFRVVGVVGIGYPAAHDEETATSASATKLRRRPVVELVHRNRW